MLCLKLKRFQTKQFQDEEDRRLYYMKDHFFADGDLHTETKRRFRIKLREEKEAEEEENSGSEPRSDNEDENDRPVVLRIRRNPIVQKEVYFCHTMVFHLFFDDR